ncbi:hypothetical protein PR048_020451 [Dryococelus australis]|uniref:Uncharacterized protein n=1 Tax=Dryococelus australis TaxID=614101 RepID=A0ABQ9H6B1_9NEOP|nr:hypothetical protein PR048_020451 [Dryococelus australis]
MFQTSQIVGFVLTVLTKARSAFNSRARRTRKNHARRRHRGKEGLGSHGLHFGAMTTSLSVLRASLNYEEQGKNRQERHLICTVQDPDGNSARLARRSDEALEVRVSVARIVPSLLDLGRGVPTGVHRILKRAPKRDRSPPYSHPPTLVPLDTLSHLCPGEDPVCQWLCEVAQRLITGLVFGRMRVHWRRCKLRREEGLGRNRPWPSIRLERFRKIMENRNQDDRAGNRTWVLPNASLVTYHCVTSLGTMNLRRKKTPVYKILFMSFSKAEPSGSERIVPERGEMRGGSPATASDSLQAPAAAPVVSLCGLRKFPLTRPQRTHSPELRTPCTSRRKGLELDPVQECLIVCEGEETGDPRENPPTSGIVRHDSPIENPVTRLGIDPDSPLWEASRLTTRPPWPRHTVAEIPSKPLECMVKGILIGRPSHGKRYGEFAHISCHKVVGIPQDECDERLLRTSATIELSICHVGATVARTRDPPTTSNTERIRLHQVRQKEQQTKALMEAQPGPSGSGTSSLPKRQASPASGKEETIAHTRYPGNSGKAPQLSKSKCFAYPSIPAHLPPLTEVLTD